MKKAKRSVTTTVCVIVALCACYLIFCGIIGKKKFFPNTSINGIDVSNMTVKEAAAAVEDQFATEYNNAGIDVTLEGKTYCIAIEEALDTTTRRRPRSASPNWMRPTSTFRWLVPR